MKTYRRHNCTRQHKTYHAFAKCTFRRAVWVIGDGPYATLAWCRSLSVMLHETEHEAEISLEMINHTACGGLCNGRHELVLLVLTPGTRNQPALPTEPEPPPPPDQAKLW
jgi:hypothetical protein